MSNENFDKEQLLAQWVVKEISDEKVVEAIGEEEFQVYQELIKATDKMDFPPYPVDAELDKLNQRIQGAAPKQKQVNFPLIRYAAAALVLIGITLTYYLLTPNYTVHRTGFGETQSLDLPDGSKVILAANSEIKYIDDAFDQSERAVQLTGQAFFDVKKGTGFEVITSEGTVRVLGTTFDVSQREAFLQVICYTGSVGVQNATINQLLAPQDALRLIDGKLDLNWKTEGSEPTWLNGITEINEANLAIAIEALRNIYGIEIISSMDLTTVPFDGAFPHNNLDIALQSVLGTENISYTYEKNKAILRIKAKP